MCSDSAMPNGAAATSRASHATTPGSIFPKAIKVSPEHGRGLAFRTSSLYEEYKAKGATILHPPESYAWALEMKVSDPDGHVLRFGSEPKE
jgi:uncharacterized glyoxalase superfamily protein PhnB